MTSAPPVSQPSQQILSQSVVSPSTSKPSSTSNRPRDGARTLVDAVTAYQRRNARPRAERNQTTRANHDPSSTASLNQCSPNTDLTAVPYDPPETPHKETNPKPTDRQPSNSASGRNRNHNHVSEFTRNSPTANKDNQSKNGKTFDHRSRSGFKPNSRSTHQTSGGFVGGRSNTNNNLPDGVAQSSKLYDPNASSQSHVMIASGSGRPPSSATPTTPLAVRHGTEKPDNTNVAGVISAKQCIKPGGGTLLPRPQSSHLIKKSSPAMDTDLTGQERWRTKKPIRGENSTTAGPNGIPRQLFDPRRHDPVKFSASKRAIEPSNIPSQSDLNDTASHGSKPQTGSSVRAHDESDLTGRGPTTDERSKPLSMIVQLKRAYKHIVSLETALKDEEFASKAKEEESKTRDFREAANGAVRINGRHKPVEDDYWVKLAKQHRELAEAHHQFLEMASDPKLPSSMHSLPQKYNIPTRLWQTGFHQLLERLRHALPSNSGQSSSQHILEHMTDFIYFAYGFYTNLLEEQSLGNFKGVWIEQLGDLARYRMAVAGLMTKLTTKQHQDLLNEERPDDEDIDLSEEDDDLVRKPIRRKRRGHRRTRGSRSDEDQSAIESLDLGSESHGSRSSDDHPSPTPVRVKPTPVTPKIPCGSIGVAALGDWEFEEQEIWRATAKDWYSKGLADSPGTGRLHHHLALLSKGDELRTLYHYAKSLTASHPYLPARESILPFFETELQSRRTRPEVSINDLFVHLHGMLFTKIQLDDFDEELARFMEKLREDRVLSERQHRARESDGQAQVFAKPSMSDSSWVMMATINICAILQYGADDGVIRVGQHLRQKSRSEFGPRHLGGKGQLHQMTAPKSLMIAPQAILVNQPSNTPPNLIPEASSLRRPSQSISSEDGLFSSSVDQHSDALSQSEPCQEDERLDPAVMIEDQMRSIKLKSDAQDGDEEGGPIVFSLAAKLSFDMLSDALQSRLSRLCPYVSLMLTFLGSMSQNPMIMHKLERFIPWSRLSEFFNSIPESIELKSIPIDHPSHNTTTSSGFRLIGRPLPEDWCLRGMEWTGKSLFGRGYWKPSKLHATDPESQLHPPQTSCPESEMDVLLSFSSGRESERRPSDPVGSSDPSSHSRTIFQQYRVDMEEDDNPDLGRDGMMSETVGWEDEARWKRIALVAVWVSKSISGFGFDPNMPRQSRFAILKSLKTKIQDWRLEQNREREEKRVSKTKHTGKARRIVEIDEEIDRQMEQDEDDEDDNEIGDSELVRSLKARRRELRAFLNQAKNPNPSRTSKPNQAQNGKPVSQASGLVVKNLSVSTKPSPQIRLNALPGHTVLVLDTNILIGMLSIVKDLLESEQWTIIIPLVVITELDGLKKTNGVMSHTNKSRLSEDANEAIKYLESSIKTKARWLKIQTSRGNYLRDLSIRYEEFNFQETGPGLDPSAQGFSTDRVQNLDDLVLRATMWQIDHFSQRLTPSEVGGMGAPTPENVVLVTLDRNLRLKARARGIVAADEKQIIGLVESSKPTTEQHGTKPVG